jgi:hypothetical protein
LWGLGGTYKELDVKSYHPRSLTFFEKTCIKSNSFVHASLRRQLSFRPARSLSPLMLLAQSEKPQGFGDSVPKP